MTADYPWSFAKGSLKWACDSSHINSGHVVLILKSVTNLSLNVAWSALFVNSNRFIEMKRAYMDKYIYKYLYILSLRAFSTLCKEIETHAKWVMSLWLLIPFLPIVFFWSNTAQATVEVQLSSSDIHCCCSIYPLFSYITRVGNTFTY